MITNYLKMFFRNLLKGKAISVVNIVSLTVGITSAVMIFLFIRSELSYDDFHDNKDQIVRLTYQFIQNGNPRTHFARVPNAWDPSMQEFVDHFPEIKTISRLSRVRGMTLKIGNRFFSEKSFYLTDSNVFDVFSIPLIIGDEKSVLRDPYSIVITESLAKKYFNTIDVIGKSIETRNNQGNNTLFQITGVMKDWPENSHIPINFLASGADSDGERLWAYTYLLLNNNTDPEALEMKFSEYIDERFNSEDENRIIYHLQPITSIHLHSNLDRELKANGNIDTIYILAAIALLMIIISGTNYINLNISRLLKRIREIGVRRSISASRRDIIIQFLTESLMTILLASIISIVLIALILPEFNHLTGQAIYFRLNGFIVMQYLMFIVFLSIISGFYPAFLFSRIDPVQNLKSNILLNKKSSKGLRNSLVILQLGIAVFLIIFTFIMNKQMGFIHHKSLGMNKDHVISLGSDIPREVKSKVNIFREKLIKYPNIIDICGTMENPSREVKDMGPSTVQNIREADDAVFLYLLPVDKHFFDLLEITFVAGTNFTHEFKYHDVNFEQNSQFLADVNNTSREYIINEKALNLIGFQSAEEAIGKNMTWSNSVLNLQPGPIVGVVRDFHFSTLEKEIKPFVMVTDPRFFGHIMMKITSNDIPGTLEKIKSVWIELFPEQPFEYHFLDDLFDQLYKQEENLNNILIIFTVLAIIISCLGLFAMVMHNTERRIKEIGLRKILGASVKNVWFQLVIQYIKLGVIANLIAWPIAWYFTKKWLLNYAFRINYVYWIFPLATVIIIVITLLTVSWQSIKAAKSNPVESLKYE